MAQTRRHPQVHALNKAWYRNRKISRLWRPILARILANSIGRSFTNLVVIREVLRGRPCRLAGAARDLKNRSATRGHGAITQSNRESAEKVIRGLDRPWKVQFISVHNEQNQMYRRLVKRHHHKLVCLSAWRRKAKQNGTKL